MMGLIEAAPRYNATDGASLMTFVSHRIRGAMRDSLRQGSWVPRSVPREARDIAKAIREIEVKEQRPARESEIAQRLGVSLPQYREMLFNSSRGHIFSADECPEIIGQVAADSPQPHEIAERDGFDDALHRAIAALPERERLVIDLMVNDDLTLRETGEVIGVTESRVCQLRTQAIARLRATLGVVL